MYATVTDALASERDGQQFNYMCLPLFPQLLLIPLS